MIKEIAEIRIDYGRRKSGAGTRHRIMTCLDNDLAKCGCRCGDKCPHSLVEQLAIQCGRILNQGFGIQCLYDRVGLAWRCSCRGFTLYQKIYKRPGLSIKRRSGMFTSPEK